MKKHVLGLVCGLVWMMAVQAQATTVVTVNPSVDTSISSSWYPDTDRSASYNLDILDSAQVYSLIKFDLSAYTGQTVTQDATLKLYFSSVWEPGTLRVHQINTPWTSDITWNTMPANFISNLTWLFNDPAAVTATEDHTLAIPASLVQGWIDHPETNYGILLATSGALSCLSSEYPNSAGWPALSFSVVPEPASVLLMMAGGLILRRRF